jgi:hypothetical protein
VVFEVQIVLDDWPRRRLNSRIEKESVSGGIPYQLNENWSETGFG